MKINIWKKSNIDMNGLVCGEKISRRQDLRTREIFGRFARVSSSRNFLTANQSVHVNVTFSQILIFFKSWFTVSSLLNLNFVLHLVFVVGFDQLRVSVARTQPGTGNASSYLIILIML